MRNWFIVLLLAGVLVVGKSSTAGAGPDRANQLQREHLMTFTGAGKTGGDPIRLYLAGFEQQPRIGDQRITIGTGQAFRMCVVRSPDGTFHALDLLGERRVSDGRVLQRTVERLPMSDLRDRGIRFRVDPGWFADLFVRDPVVFRIRVTDVKRASAFTMRIQYLNNYDQDIRKTLILHARSTGEGWNLIRHEPVDHRINTNLHLVSRRKVNGVRIQTTPVDAGGTLHPERGE